MLMRSYRQKATYWGVPTSNGVGGESFATPVVLLVRWEDRKEQFTMEDGELAVSNAIVFVKQDVEIGGYLYLGETDEASPHLIPEAFPIRQFRKVPNLRAVTSERRAFL